MNTNFIRPALGAIVSALALCWQARAELPANYRIMEGSASPDGSLAVLEPVGDRVSDEAFWKMRNQIVEVKSQHVIGTIEGVPGMKHMNHGGATAQWSASGDALLWYVGGKWGPRSVTFLQLKDGTITRQTDVVKAGYAELLKRAQKAHPKTYAAAKKHNAGSGAAFPDGFAASLAIKQPVENEMPKFPVEFVVTFTANPKGMEDYPAEADLEGFLFGSLSRSMEIKWGDSAVYNAAAHERLFAEGEGVDEVIAHLSDAVATDLPKDAKARFEAEEKAWDESMNAAGEKWPIHQSVSTCLAEKIRQDVTWKRIKELQGMTGKKKKR